MAETTYIVLRQVYLDDSMPSPDMSKVGWERVSDIPATSADAAIRLACKNDNAPAGMYVAVPHRSWKPVQVSAVQTTVLKLEEATTTPPDTPPKAS